MEAGVGGRPFLVRAPAEFGRLHPLGQEALDRPGVDEYVARLRALSPLSVALGDVHALDPEPLGEAAPLVPGLRLGRLVAEIVGKMDERLLHEPGDHAGIGAAARDGGRSARILAPLRHHCLAQRVVGARLVAERLVIIEARPRLDDGVDVEGAELAAIAHDVERRGVDRKVDAEALAFARGQVFLQRVAIIFAREAEMDEADAAFVEELAIGVARVDDDEALLIEFEVALDQRQRPFADRSEADHHDRAGDPPVARPMRHGVRSPLVTSDAERPGRRLKPRPSGRVNSPGGGVSVAKLSCPAQRARPDAERRRGLLEFGLTRLLGQAFLWQFKERLFMGADRKASWLAGRRGIWRWGETRSR